MSKVVNAKVFRFAGSVLAIVAFMSYAVFKARGWYLESKEFYKRQRNKSKIVPLISATNIPMNVISNKRDTSNMDPADSGPSNSGCRLNPGPSQFIPLNAGPSKEDPSNAGPSYVRALDPFPSNAGSTNASPSNVIPSNASPTSTEPITVGLSNAGLSNAGPSNAGHSNAGTTNTDPSNTSPYKADPLKAKSSTPDNSIAGPSNAEFSSVFPCKTRTIVPTNQKNLPKKNPFINNQAFNPEIVKSGIYSMILFVAVPMTCFFFYGFMFFMEIEFFKIMALTMIYFFFSIILVLPIYMSNSSLRHFTYARFVEMFLRN